jgi:chromosome segregation ATPase
VDEKVLDFSEELQQRIHLATGIRMEVCQDILSYFAQLQTRNKLLINAVEFFNEYLTKISQLEGDKITREKQIGQLLQDKEGLFLTKYDLERKIAEMTTELKKAQGHEKETVQELKSLQKRIDAKVAECDSLKFRIRHLEDQLQNQTEFVD